MKSQLHYLSAAHCAAPVTFGSELPLLTECLIAGLIHYSLLLLVDDINTKSHGGCCRLRLFVTVGDGSRKTRFPPCRRRHPQRHALHDDNSRHGSKSGLWPFKKSAVGGKKNSSLCYSIYMTLPIGNKVIIFLYRRSRTFFTANGGLFAFAAFQPAIGQARMGVAGNFRELALEIFTDTHGRKGRSPEKPQIFL